MPCTAAIEVLPADLPRLLESFTTADLSFLPYLCIALLLVLLQLYRRKQHALRRRLEGQMNFGMGYSGQVTSNYVQASAPFGEIHVQYGKEM